MRERTTRPAPVERTTMREREHRTISPKRRPAVLEELHLNHKTFRTLDDETCIFDHGILEFYFEAAISPPRLVVEQIRLKTPEPPPQKKS